jgi:hypothetical protein
LIDPERSYYGDEVPKGTHGIFESGVHSAIRFESPYCCPITGESVSALSINTIILKKVILIFYNNSIAHSSSTNPKSSMSPFSKIGRLILVGVVSIKSIAVA